MKILYISLLILIGIIASQTLYHPFSLIVMVLSAVGGFCVALSKSWNVILKLGNLTWTQSDFCRHFLITGDTGSGKTTSGFHPILVQITQNVPNWGGLVLGVKGDESQFIRELAEAHGREHDLIEFQVRPPDQSSNWKPPHRYNLLSNRKISWMTHAKAIIDIAASLTEGTQHPFFRSTAQQALATGFEVLDELGYPVTLTRAYELLTSKDRAAAYVKLLLKKEPTEKRKQLAEYLQSVLTKAQAYEQREATEGTLRGYLGYFLDSDVAEVFSSDEPNTFSMSEVDQGAIITLSMPQTLQTERRYIQTYLKILFYYHSLQRFDKSSEERKNENLLLLVADEFQAIATASEDGIADHNVIDRIRAANTALIAGMQSEVSLDPVIGQNKREVLSLNMRSRLVFRGADEKGAVASANFIGKRSIWKKTKTSKPLGVITTSKREEQEFYVKPSKITRLPDHTVIIVHPSKKFIRKKTTPVDGSGERYQWY